MNPFPFRAWLTLGRVALAASALVACADEADSLPDDTPGQDTGVVDGPDSGSTEELIPGELDYPASEPGETALRRLTQAQYANIMYDTFGEDLVLPPLSEPDVDIEGLVAIGASSASVTARGVESMESASFIIAEQVMDDEAMRDAWLNCSPSGTVDSECSATFVRDMGLHLWRRPLTDEEVTRVAGLADNAAETLGDFYDGLEYALAGLLQSPNFLFRVELGSEREFNDYEMATRLSFFLWNTTPDAELLAAAEAGELTTKEGLLAHAQRMLADERSRRAVRNFFVEYLHLNRLTYLSKDPNLFESYTSDLGPDAMEETLRVIEYLVFERESDFREIMTTRQTFVNPRLAALYNIPAPNPDGWAAVKLPADGPRAGLLGQASTLNLHAHPVASSATLRGLFVRTTLLCESIPPPPVNVDTAIPEPTERARTLRDRIAIHLEDPSCASCHLITDPIGLGLENFDAVGRFRTSENGEEIDPSGDLDGVEFSDAVELGQALGEHPGFSQCLVRSMTRYAVGRPEVRDEVDLVERLGERFAEHGYQIQPLILEIVMSPMFRDAGDPR